MVGGRQVSVEPLRPEDPRRIGPFDLLGYVGRGGYGTVYVSYEPGTAKPVAVKRIRAVNPDPQWRLRLQHEVDAIRRVGDELTAAFVAADTEDAEPWLATRFIPAPTLQQVVRRYGALSERGGWWLLASLAEALFGIHAQNLLHRDLKPGNVLVTRDRVKVIDFGLAKTVSESGSDGITTHPMYAGTRFYAAPEQLDDIRKATPKSDVYGLAATMVFALAGHAPYDDFGRWANGELPDLGGVPDGFRGLLADCLTKDPAGRPTVSDLVDVATLRVVDAGVALFMGTTPPLAEAFLAADPLIAVVLPAPVGPALAPAASAGSPSAAEPLPSPDPSGLDGGYEFDGNFSLNEDAEDYDLVPASSAVSSGRDGKGAWSGGAAWAERWQSGLDSGWDRYDG